MKERKREKERERERESRERERVLVVEQLVERSLPTLEICGSNPVFGKIYELSTVLKSRKQRKEVANGPFLKKQES